MVMSNRITSMETEAHPNTKETAELGPPSGPVLLATDEKSAAFTSLRARVLCLVVDWKQVFISQFYRTGKIMIHLAILQNR